MTFAYTYVTGFGGGTVGANFTLAVAGTAVYSSPILNKYPYGGAYSPPVNVAWRNQSIAVPSSGGGMPHATPPKKKAPLFHTLAISWAASPFLSFLNPCPHCPVLVVGKHVHHNKIAVVLGKRI